MISLLIPVTAIVIISLIAGFWTIPNVREFRNVTTNTELARKELEQTLIPRRDALAQIDNDEVAAIVSEFDSVFPQEADPGLVLGVLELLSAEHELDLTEQTYLRQNTNTQMLEFSFNLFGTAANLDAFLAHLDEVKPIIYVLQFASSLDINDDGSSSIDADLVVQSPYGISVPSSDSTMIVRGLSDVDRQLYTELQERTNYFDSELYFGSHETFPRGKEDPFIE